MSCVMFVHGAWVGPRCWDRWRQRFSARGISSIAPPWPLQDRPYGELRESPYPALADIGVNEIVEHYAKLASTLPQAPLLIGHSFGGLIVQLLLARGIGTAAVAVDPAPPRGVFPTPRALLTAWPILSTWRGWKRVFRMTYEEFVAGFVHKLPEADRRRVYEEETLPTPGRPYFQAAFAPFHRATALDFDKSDRAPLLILAGGADRTAPPAMVRANFRAYRKSKAVTAFHQFPNRSHWIIAEPGWEEVADFSLSWAQAQGALPERPIAASSAHASAPG
ncbi:MAG TPA: alpha/beta hydrolase [Polyangia bacterium]